MVNHGHKVKLFLIYTVLVITIIIILFRLLGLSAVQ